MRHRFFAPIARISLAIAITMGMLTGVSETPAIALPASAPTDFSLAFDGSTTYASTSAQVIPATGSFTVEAWVKPTDGVNSNARTIVSQGSGSNRFYMKRYNGQLYYYVDGQAAENKCGAIPQNQWTHIAVTITSTHAICYLNGVLQVDTTVSGATSIGSKFVVGAYAASLSASGTAFLGQIDEVKVWKIDRTQSNIQATKDAAPTLNAANLNAYYDFNDGSGISVANRSTSSDKVATSDLSITGTPAWTDNNSQTVSGGYTVTTFNRSYITSAGGWTTPTGVGTVDVLVVGGGGGGGKDGGAGGAGGGAYLATGVTVSSAALINVKVATGGNAGLYNVIPDSTPLLTVAQSAGETSTVSVGGVTYTGTGGAAGATGISGYASPAVTGGTGSISGGTGGTAYTGASSGAGYGWGRSGGIGTAGGNGTFVNNWLGTSTTYGGGGAGGADRAGSYSSAVPVVLGGAGGGGNAGGLVSGVYVPATAGAAGTGGGGGAGLADSASQAGKNSAAGGSGVVLIRYQSPIFSANTPTFPTTSVGSTSSAQVVTVTNSGSAPLIFGASSETITGTNASEFAITADTCANNSIPSNATCTVSVTFSPSAAGSRNAVLNFSDNAYGNVQQITLIAVGSAATSVGPMGDSLTVNTSTSTGLGSLVAHPLVITGYPSGDTLRVVVKTTLGTINETATAAAVLSATGNTLTAATGYPAIGGSGASIGLIGTTAALNAALATLQLNAPSSGGSATISVDVSDAGTGTIAYNPDNGRFYQYVSTPMTWDAAYNAITGASLTTDLTVAATSRSLTACNYTFNGMCGYFAVIRNSTENSFVSGKVGTNPAWLGGSDRIQQGVWVWSDPAAPEYNKQFSNMSSNYVGRPDQVKSTTPYDKGTYAGGSTGQPTSYLVTDSLTGPTTYSYVNWGTGEPNNYAGNETALQIVSGGNGVWNDLNEFATGNQQGFIVEYGGNNETLTYPVAHRTITATIVAGATSFTISGPRGGGSGVPSDSFTVTPNGIYNGTITITPSGAAPTTPITLTFSNSSTPQTFTVTPNASGTVTLTPSNSGGLTNPSNVTYISSAASKYTFTGPTSLTANQQSGLFTIDAIGTYNDTITVAVTGGGITQTIQLRFVPTDDAKTFTLTPTDSGTITVTVTSAPGLTIDTSVANSASSASAFSYVVGASGYSLTGPSTGFANSPSSNFTIAPNGSYTGTMTITVFGEAGSQIITQTYSGSNSPQSFNFTPADAGTVTISVTSNPPLGIDQFTQYTVTTPTPVLYVNPDGINVGAGFTPTYTFQLEDPTLSGSTIVDPSTLSSYVAPVCSSSYTSLTAYSGQTFTISCTGGSATGYVFDVSATDVLTVVPEAVFTYQSPFNLTTGSALSGVQPTVNSGTATSWLISPDLPSPLVFNTSTGEITGTPSSTMASTDYSVTAYNNGLVGQETITLVIAAGSTPAASTPTPIPAQQNSISGISPSSGPISGGTMITILGSFPTTITSIQFGGVSLAPGSWAQTGTSITFKSPIGTSGPVSIVFFDGQAPQLPAQTFTYTNAPVVGPQSLPALTNGTPVNFTITAQNGTSFTVTSGTLPTGLVLNPTTGVISGTPTGSGPYSFTVLISNASGATTTITFTGIIGSNGNGSNSGTNSSGTGSTNNTSALPTIAPITPPASIAGATVGGNISVLVDGNIVSAHLHPNTTNTGYVLTAPGWGLNLNPLDNLGNPVPLNSAGQVVLNTNHFVSVTGDGFLPNSLVNVYIFSTPTLLGVVKTDASGNFVSKLPVTDSLNEGSHTLQVDGLSPAKEIRSASIGLLVVKAAVASNATGSGVMAKGATGVVPFETAKYKVETTAQLAIVKSYQFAKRATVLVTGYASKSAGEDDIRISLDRALEVKHQLLKLHPNLNIQVQGGGITKNRLCAATSNQCAVIKVIS